MVVEEGHHFPDCNLHPGGHLPLSWTLPMGGPMQGAKPARHPTGDLHPHPPHHTSDAYHNPSSLISTAASRRDMGSEAPAKIHYLIPDPQTDFCCFNQLSFRVISWCSTVSERLTMYQRYFKVSLTTVIRLLTAFPLTLLNTMHKTLGVRDLKKLCGHLFWTFNYSLTFKMEENDL